MKPKDLIPIPWMVAMALQADGWYLRSDIIWHKPNPMPESVTDRPTKAHEYLFLLAKQERYYYDAAAIREPHVRLWNESNVGPENWVNDPTMRQYKLRSGDTEGGGHDGLGKALPHPLGANRRTVWTVATQPYSGAHFATFPPDLIEPCIKAGCPEKVCVGCGEPWQRRVEREPMVIDRSGRTHDMGRTRSSGTMLSPPKVTDLGLRPSCECGGGTKPGTVLDPFGGAGTTGLVADRLQRNALLIELNPEYVAMAEARIYGDAPLFAEVSR